MRWRRWGQAIFVLISLALLGWVAFAHPNWMLQIGQLNILSGLIVLFVLLSPLGSLSLGNASIDNRMVWLSKIVTAQISLFILFFASIVAYVNIGPQLLSPALSSNVAFSTVQQYTLKEWGIFPWAVYSFWGVLLGYVVFFKKGDPYFYQIGLKICPKVLEPVFKNFVTFTCSGANVMVISFTIASIILLGTFFLQKLIFAQPETLPILIVFGLYFVMLFFGFRWGKRFLNRLVRKRRSLVFLTCALTILLSLFYLLSGTANQWLLVLHPDLGKSLVCHQCTAFFDRFPVELRWAAFYMGWWLMWTPLIGSYLIKISQGRTLREMIMFLLALPMLILFFMFLKPYFFLSIINFAASFQMQSSLLLAIGSLVLLSRILKNAKNVNWFFCGELSPVSDQKSRRSLNDGAKSTGFVQFYQRICTSTIVILLIHTLAGWYGIQFQLSVIGFIITMVVLMGACFFIAQLMRNIFTSRSIAPD